MNKLAVLCFAMAMGSSAFAADVQRGICTGLTTSGKTVTLSFCSWSEGGTKLVSCTPRGRGRADIFAHVTFRDGTVDTNTMTSKYSVIQNNKEDAFEAQAYSITRRDLRSGIQDYNWVSVMAQAGQPSQFSMDLGPGWRFEFHNAECHFESL